MTWSRAWLAVLLAVLTSVGIRCSRALQTLQPTADPDAVVIMVMNPAPDSVVVVLTFVPAGGPPLIDTVGLVAPRMRQAFVLPSVTLSEVQTFMVILLNRRTSEVLGNTDVVIRARGSVTLVGGEVSTAPRLPPPPARQS